MSKLFHSGELSYSEAEELTRYGRRLEALERLTVAAPLQITKGAGIPCISLQMASLDSGALSFDVSSLAATLYSISANDAWQDTGLSIDLPDAGDYILLANVTGLAQMSAITGSIPPYIQVRLFNVTASTPVLVDGAGNETIVVQPPVTGLTFLNTVAVVAPITVGVATTIRLEAKRNTVFGSGAFSAAQIYRADGQPVNMGYVTVG